MIQMMNWGAVSDARSLMIIRVQNGPRNKEFNDECKVPIHLFSCDGKETLNVMTTCEPFHGARFLLSRFRFDSNFVLLSSKLELSGRYNQCFITLQ